MRLRRFARWMLSLALFAAAVITAVVGWWLHTPLGSAGDQIRFEVPAGASAREIAAALSDAGLPTSPFLLAQWFRWSGQERKIRAGSYAIDPVSTPIALLETLVRGEQAPPLSITLLEGWTFHRLRAELATADGLIPSTASLSDDEIMSLLGAPGLAPEGRFFPDTYFYRRGNKDFVVLEQSYRTMLKRLESAWNERTPDTPLRNADEALTLASIVEKETGAADERGLVAAVFVNRLRIGMPLQTDPTVIYGLGNRFDGNLRKRDLLTDTPFNTYTRGGLPPTPISMPGEQSLLAAVKPDPTRALYFVARGDGSSHFSETLAEHNRAVDKYQRRRREAAR